MASTKTPPGIWCGQLLHFACLLPLLALTWGAWVYQGKPFPVAFWIAIAFPVVHRNMPLVKDGIFRFTNNGMYIYAFLLFWAIAIGFNSTAALTVAAFSHAYIWVHFYATEKPDMDYLYAEA